MTDSHENVGSNGPELTETGAQEKYGEIIKSLYNAKVAISLPEEEIKRQYIKSIKLAGASVTDVSVFRNGHVSPPEGRDNLTKKDVDAVYLAKVKKIKTTTGVIEKLVPRLVKPLRGKDQMIDSTLDGLGLGYMTAKTGILGPVCLSTLMVPSMKVLALPVCFEFFTSGISLYDQFQQVGNSMRNSRNLRSNSQNALNLLGGNVYAQFGSAGNYKFDVSGDFAFKLDNSSVNLPALFDHTSSAEEEELSKVLFEQNIKELSLNPEKFEEFFSEYIEKLGGLQQEILREKINNDTRERKEETVRRQEQALLYSSVGQLFGAIASRAMGSNEARLFNALMPYAAQLALAGTLGPIGWAAVGATVATTLLNGSRSGADPNKLIFKALAQIQKQLEVINENIELIHKSQSKILNSLNLVLGEIQEVKHLLVEGLEGIQASIDRLDDRLDVADVQDLNRSYEESLTKIYKAIAKDDESFEHDVLNNINALVTIATSDLSKYAVNRYDDGYKSHSGSELKTLIFNSKADSAVSIYDTIGLITALANYDFTSKTGRNSSAVVHPVFFYQICGQIVDCLVISGLPLKEKKDVVTTLISEADASRQVINECCHSVIVNEIADKYLTALEEVIYSLRQKLQEYHGRNYGDNKEAPGYEGLPVFGKIYFPEIISNFDSNQLTNSLHKFANFQQTDEYDDALLNVARQAGIITDISRENRGMSGVNYRHLYRVVKEGSVVGTKINKLTMDNLLLKYDADNNLELRLPTSVSFTYKIDLISAKLDRDPARMARHDRDRYKFRVVEFTVDNGVKDLPWQKTVGDSLKRIGKSLADIIPDSPSMNFHDFLDYLLSQQLLYKKSEYAEEGAKLFDSFSDQIDGAGVSLMVLSKLNKVVTDGTLIPYEIDYNDEVFTKDDLVKTLRFYTSRHYAIPDGAEDPLHKKFVEIFREITGEFNRLDSSQQPPPGTNKLYNPLFLKDERFPLYPSSYIDLLCILLKRRVIKTAQTCKSNLRDIKENDCEPYLADAINTLNWLNSFYLNGAAAGS